MTDPTDGGAQWIIEPPSPGEIRFHIATGEGVELTEEQQRALAVFLRELESRDAEVAGFADCTLTSRACWVNASCTQVFSNCPKLGCNSVTCTLTSRAAVGGSGLWSVTGSIAGRIV